MEEGRRLMIQGRAGSKTGNSNELTPLNQRGGSEPQVEKSILELLQKYPEQDQDLDGDTEGVMGSPSARLRAQILKKVGVGVKTKEGSPDGQMANKPDRLVCILYWMVVVFIGGLIAFSMWLAVKISIRNSLIQARKCEYILFFFCFFFYLFNYLMYN